jgi:hypothetical protein
VPRGNFDLSNDRTAPTAEVSVPLLANRTLLGPCSTLLPCTRRYQARSRALRLINTRITSRSTPAHVFRQVLPGLSVCRKGWQAVDERKDGDDRPNNPCPSAEPRLLGFAWFAHATTLTDPGSLLQYLA